MENNGKNISSVTQFCNSWVTVRVMDGAICFIKCDRLQENRAQRGPDKKIFFCTYTLLGKQILDIKLSKFYRRSFSHSRYISPNRSLR